MRHFTFLVNKQKSGQPTSCIHTWHTQTLLHTPGTTTQHPNAQHKPPKSKRNNSIQQEPKFDHQSKNTYHDFPTLLSPYKKHIVYQQHIRTQNWNNMNSYIHIYPISNYTSQASNLTKQSNFHGYSFNITTSKPFKTFNSTQKKRKFNLPSQPFHNFKTSIPDFYVFPSQTKASTILGELNILDLKP